MTPEINNPQIDEVLRNRVDIVMNTLGSKFSDTEKKSMIERIASDYANAPSNISALVQGLNSLPFRARLRWHGEGALVNFATFVVAGAGVAFITQKINKRREARGEQVIGTDTNPFESTENVEATGRARRGNKAAGESHLHTAH